MGRTTTGTRADSDIEDVVSSESVDEAGVETSDGENITADATVVPDVPPAAVEDTDPAETQEWLESLHYVLESKGPERVSYLLSVLDELAHRHGVELPFTANTPYINTIPADRAAAYPGNREIERRIKSIIRWNAMAMVVRANKRIARHRRPHLHLRLGGHAVRSRLQPLLPRQGQTTSRATRSTSRATPRPASTPGPSSKAG